MRLKAARRENPGRREYTVCRIFYLNIYFDIRSCYYYKTNYIMCQSPLFSHFLKLGLKLLKLIL